MEQNINNLLKDRYFLEHENTWEDLSNRISTIYPPSFELIRDKKFIPSTPTLMNANTNGKRKGTLSSCFTMDIEDSIDGIFDALKEGAIVTKASGGVGYVFSKLRSSKENINSLNRPSSGPIPFMRMFNSMLDGIQQGGVRRGAGMGQIDIFHPDILEIIRLKNTKGEMERLNLSIRVTDEFYTKLKQNPDFPHIVYDMNNNPIPLEDKGEVVTVGKLWDEIIEYAWRCAEPGIFNSDIAYKQYSTKNISEYVLSNPCSEYVSGPYSSCNLGSFNLVKYYQNGKFNWEQFKLDISVGTRYLDNVIDANEFPIDKIRQVTLQTRPIGLGTMGLAHVLYLLNIPFNSKEGYDFAEKIAKTLTCYSMLESIKMCKDGKESYSAFDYDIYVDANKRYFEDEYFIDDIKTKDVLNNLKKYKIRNSCQTSQAPTGSIGFIANASSGIEPVFALTYARKIEKLDKQYEVVYISDPIFDLYLNTNFDIKVKEKILKQVAENKGSCQKVEEIPEDMKKVFVVASDLTPMEHLQSLSVFTKWISLSTSKTVNLDSSATKEEIGEIYLKAHELGVIGITVYRDGCREGILVHKTDNEDNDIIVRTNAPKRPKSLPCHVYKMSILNRTSNEPEKWIVFVGLLKGEPYEIIAGKVNGVDIPSSITDGEMIKTKKNGKKVYQFSYNNEILIEDVCGTFLNELREYSTRLMSLALRHGAGIEHLQTVLKKSGTIVDFNQAIVRGITRYCKEMASKERCPTCNDELIFIEGCIKCKNPECSYSKCG